MSHGGPKRVTTELKPYWLVDMDSRQDNNKYRNASIYCLWDSGYVRTDA